LKILEAGHGKPCNTGRLRDAEGCRPYRLRYKIVIYERVDLRSTAKKIPAS